MTLEPGHEPTEWGSVPRPTTHATFSATGQPVHYNSARHGNHVEESPELLRWRADLLMDEMMMGGVDVSAADGNRTFSGVDAPIVQRSQPPSPQPSSNGGTHYGDAGQENYGRTTDDRESYDHGGYDRNSYDNHPVENGSRVNGENGNYGYSTNGQNTNGQSNGHGQQRPYGTNGGTYGDTYPSPSSSQRVNPDAPYVAPSDANYNGEPRNFGTSDFGTRPYDDGRERGYYVGEQGAEGGPQNRPVGGETPADSQPSPRTPDASTPTGNGNPAPRTDRLYMVEQQYEQFHREQNANVEPIEPPFATNSSTTSSANASAIPPINQSANQAVNPPQMATRPPLPPIEPPRQPTKPPRVTPPAADENTQWAVGPDKWEYQDFAAQPQEEEEESLFGVYPTPDRRVVQERAVRQDSAQYVSAMSVLGSSKKRSTLLPRSSELDIDNLHREISDLHGEIAVLLPVGNETSERARHLLDKAYSILQSDPSRSAEVEYYMQQVRTIVQRLHQARKWSDLYRQRLHLYLWAWLGLSAVMLIATFLFQSEMEEALMWLLGIGPESVLVQNWTTFLGTAFAGALGGAIGALYTMEGHARGEHSFFDRKYGLRGLILPFMGLIVGAVGYLIFGLIFVLLGVDPSESLTVAIVPIAAAFAFGFSQESIYGTRG